MIVHVPLDPSHLDGTADHWRPWLEGIARDIACHAGDLIELAYRGEMQLHLAYDPENKKALALLGSRLLKRGNETVAELSWCSGENLPEWSGLLPEVERYFREHWNCVGIAAHCRPGWKPFLKGHGYRMTHIIMEKEL